MSRFVVSAVVAASLFLACPAQAQQSVVRRSFVTPYLERVIWTPQERGPLLVVSPDTMIRVLNGAHSPDMSKLSREGGINVLDFAAAMERKLARTGTLSALVMEKMLVLNSKLRKPDLSQLSSHDALVALAASLDERQWQLLCGTNGLGLHDLSAQQQPLFSRILPQGLLVGNFGAPNAMPVPPSAIAQSRLQISRALQFWFAYQDEKLNGGFGGSFSGSVQGNDTRPKLSKDFRARGQSSANYGVTLSEVLPNRLKPSQLDYKSTSFDKRIALEGAKTIEELLGRVTQATGFEIRGDKRIAELSLWLRNTPDQSARAGDLLELLALSVTGAFRKLEAPGQRPLWLLTDDIEGLATRQARQERWRVEAEKLVSEVRHGYRERFKATKPEHFISTDNSYGLSPELIKSVQGVQAGGQMKTAVPLNALPKSISDQLETILKQQIKSQEEGHSQSSINGVLNPPLDPSRIRLSQNQLDLSVIVPGYGVYQDQSTASSLGNELQNASQDQTTRPPAPEPVRPEIRTRIAIFAPKTPAEAQQALTAAATARLSAVWIATDGGKLETLKAALEEGKKVGIPVGATVALARLPENAPADLNLLGETGPYRIPDAPETAAALLPYLRTLAALPGLAGLALTETAAPGYLSGALSRFGRSNTSEYGYTPARRLSFVRTEGYDPIDLGTFSDVGFLTNPMRNNRMVFRSPDGTPQPTPPPNPMERWNRVRFEANKALMSQVYSALKEVTPALPFWLKSRAQEFSQSDWFGSWDKADALPTFVLAFPTTPLVEEERPDPYNPLPQARRTSRQILFTRAAVRFEGDKTPLANWWSWTLTSGLYNQKTFPWDGVVLDLSALPIEKAIAALQEIKL
ncbi:hypothetical protein [Armatimonas sp.]|uniref:hypothetical protein n=1 Tax=Armatimonas sp. TaxID=1872638 RepID=UPI0037504D88